MKIRIWSKSDQGIMISTTPITDELCRIAQQIADFTTEETGGCAYSYAADLSGYDYIHSEISGYALSFFVFLEQAGIQEFKHITDNLAAFLINHQHPCGGFPHSIRSGEGFPKRNNEIYCFDTGICASALIDFAAHRDDPAAYKTAQMALDWLVFEGQMNNGSFRCEFSTKTGRWNSPARDLYWSSSEGIYLSKMLIPLIKGGRFGAAERLLDWMLSQQLPNGAWWASPRCPQVHSHALLYALEGLSYYCARNEHSEASRALHKCLNWIEHETAVHRGLPTWINGRPVAPHFRSDVQLQCLRLARIHEKTVSENSAKSCKIRLASLRHPNGCWFFDNSKSGARLPVWPLIFEGNLLFPEIPDRLI